jgi:hypothetical protein
MQRRIMLRPVSRDRDQYTIDASRVDSVIERTAAGPRQVSTAVGVGHGPMEHDNATPHVFPNARRPGELLFAMLFLAIGFALLSLIMHQTQWLPGKGFAAQPRTWPLIGLGGMVLFGALYLWSTNSNPRTPGRWREAVEGVGAHRVVPGLRVVRPPRPPVVLFHNTMRHLLVTAAVAGYLAWAEALRGAGRSGAAGERPWLVLSIAALVGLTWAAPHLVRAGRAWLRVVPVDGALREIAHAVHDALRETGRITTPAPDVELRIEEHPDGSFFVALQGATFREQSVFADSVNEVIGPIANPRYLITRGDGRRADIHAVPFPLARWKETAEVFHRHWVRRLGPAELVFTRTADGRRLLLRARARAFSAGFVEPARRLDRWH